MAQVTVKVNGYAYTMGCKDGEEPHLAAMAEQVEKRVDKARSLGSQSGEAKLLLMAAVMLADELHDMAIELGAAKKGKAGSSDRARHERLAKLAERAEAIAATAEQH